MRTKWQGLAQFYMVGAIGLEPPTSAFREQPRPITNNPAYAHYKNGINCQGFRKIVCVNSTLGKHSTHSTQSKLNKQR